MDDAYSKYRNNLLTYARYFVEQAKANGFGACYWMGLSDGAVRSKPEFNQPDLVEVLVKGYYGEGGFVDVRSIPEDGTRCISDGSSYTLSGIRLPANSHKKGLRIVNKKIVIYK